MTAKISSLVAVLAATFLLVVVAANASAAPTFTYEKQIVSTGSEAGTVSIPLGLAVDSQGRLYASQQGPDFVRVFDNFKTNNAPLNIIGQPGTGPGQFKNPFGLTVDESGSLYVADNGNRRVERFTSPGSNPSYQGSFLLPAVPGGEPDDTSEPVGITRGPAAGRLYVSSIDNPIGNQVHLLGSSVAEPPVSAAEADSIGVFEMPVGIATDQAGRLYVADATEHRIAVYSSYAQGHQLLRVFGKFGADPGELNYPVGIAVDSLGRVYVAEYAGTAGGSRIQVFASFGDGNQFLATFSQKQTADVKYGFRHLTAIAIDGTRVYVSDVSCVEPSLAPCETSPSEDAIWRFRFDDADGDGVFDSTQEKPDESTPSPDEEPTWPTLTYSDSGAPSSFITAPRARGLGSLRKVRRQLRRVAGYAIDAESFVVRVDVTIVARTRVRRGASRCRALTRTGLKRIRCRKPRYLHAKLADPGEIGGKQRWTLRLSPRQLRALARGRYRVSSRATDLAGNVERSLRRNRNLRTFHAR